MRSGNHRRCSRPTTAIRKCANCWTQPANLKAWCATRECPRPLNELVPLHRTKNDDIVTAFDMVAIEKLGLLKMAFLGLTTLTILDDAVKLIAQTRGEHIALDGLQL